MKKLTKAEKMAEHDRVVQELKIAKKRLRQLARFALGIEKYVYTTDIYYSAEKAKILVKNPKHPNGCDETRVCRGVPENPCFLIAHWIREEADIGSLIQERTVTLKNEGVGAPEQEAAP